MITAMRSEAVTSILTLLRTEFQRVSGMLDMAKKIGIEQNKIIAVGDMNDISMLGSSGNFVCS